MKSKHVKRQRRKQTRSENIDAKLLRFEKWLEKFMVERFPTIMYYTTYLPEKPTRWTRKRIW